MEGLDLPYWLKQGKEPDKYIDSNGFQALEYRQPKRVIPKRKETNVLHPPGVRADSGEISRLQCREERASGLPDLKGQS